MRTRNPLLLFLLCATIIASAAPMVAHGAQQNAPPSGGKQAGPPPPENAAEIDAQRTIPGAYRLTYTLTEMDGNRKIGSQHYTIILDADAPHAHLHLESRIPILRAGTNNYAGPVHVGIRLDSQLRKFQNGLELNSGIMQTVLTDDQKGQYTTNQPPMTRDYEMYGTVLMQENHPTVLWKLDIPGSTYILEVQAELTRIQ